MPCTASVVELATSSSFVALLCAQQRTVSPTGDFLPFGTTILCCEHSSTMKEAGISSKEAAHAAACLGVQYSQMHWLNFTCVNVNMRER